MSWLDWLDILFGGRPREWMLRLSQALTCKRFTHDLGLVMQKACFGRIPKGKYIEYHVYTKHLSREELCVFLPEGALQRIDACSQVNVRSMSSRMLSYTIDEVHTMSAGITMAITLDFEGRMPDGQAVSIHMKDKQVIASLTVDPTWYWKLVRLKPVHTD